MATLQKRTSRGHTYWSIVESRRVNGKPRPVIIEYLGTAENLLRRLQEGLPQKVKSYSHGHVAALLDVAEELEVVQTINRHLPAERRQMRDNFTVGGSLLLAAIGRACRPTSKLSWYSKCARHTSLSFLTGMSLSKLDSQHFWDQMEALPVSAIPLIEEELVRRVVEKQNISMDVLLCDMSNFFTYIASTNHRCQIAQRGKNKQKRMDLRQFGVLLAISRKDHIPLIHKVYQGNLQDRTVFKAQFFEMMNRFKSLTSTLEEITLVFDQGNNSKRMLYEVERSVHFVGALSPYDHKGLIQEANKSMSRVRVKQEEIECYRARRLIWDLDLTVVVYISETLRRGQIHGIEQNIRKLFAKLSELKNKIQTPTRAGRKRTRESLGRSITSLFASCDLDRELIGWNITELSEDAFALDFWIDSGHFDTLKNQWLGRRILITNRHDWSTENIVLAYWGQAEVEYAFKNLKNPYHLAVRPQYHWTDQKIEVHGFICMLAFLLSMVIYKRAREGTDFTATPNELLEKLSKIRLATFIENPHQKTKGRYKTTHRVEEMDEDIRILAETLGLTDTRAKPKIPFSVYEQRDP
jgi:transposase